MIESQYEATNAVDRNAQTMREIQMVRMTRAFGRLSTAGIVVVVTLALSAANVTEAAAQIIGSTN